MTQQTDANQALTQLRDAINVALERQPIVEVWLPVTVRNESNQRDRWGAVKRAKAHRTAAHLTTRAALGRNWPVGGWRGAELVVLLTRAYSGRQKRMDDDGATRATKSVRDGVADALGITDADPRVTWVPTQQERGSETGVRVQIFERRQS